MKKAICLIVVMCCGWALALAADQGTTVAQPATAATPALVAVDLDSKIADLKAQIGQLEKAYQKNTAERKQLEMSYTAVAGALNNLVEMKKEATKDSVPGGDFVKTSK